MADRNDPPRGSGDTAAPSRGHRSTLSVAALRAFVAMAGSENQTAAAEALQVQPSAVNAAIATLERYIARDGSKTLYDQLNPQGRPEPGRPTVRLTAEGRRLLRCAQRFVAAAAEVEQVIDSIRAGVGGLVRIGTTASISNKLLRDLSRFKEEERNRGPRKEIKISIRQAYASDLEKLVVNGEIDVAFLAIRTLFNGGVLQEHLDRHSMRVLEGAVMPGDRMVLVFGEKYADFLRDHKKFRLRDIEGRDFIIFREGYQLRDTVEMVFRDQDVKPNIVLEGAELNYVIEAAMVGLGVALVPEIALDDGAAEAGHEARDGRRPAVQHAVITPKIERLVGMVWRPAPFLSEAAERFRTFMLKRSELNLDPERWKTLKNERLGSATS